MEKYDKANTNFDFKWGNQSKDIDFNSLKKHQIVNYFHGTGALTTKAGISASLRSLPWWNAGEPDCLEWE
jgi:hypothetical protein